MLQVVLQDELMDNLRAANPHWSIDELRAALLDAILADPGTEILPIRKSALFGWVLTFGKDRPRPPSDQYVVVPIPTR